MERSHKHLVFLLVALGIFVAQASYANAMSAPSIAPNYTVGVNGGRNLTSLNVDFPIESGSQGGTVFVPNAVDTIYVAIVCMADGNGTEGTVSTPSGWTLVTGYPENRSNAGTVFDRQYVFYKTYDASEGLQQTFTASVTATKFTGAILLVGGASISSPAAITLEAGQQTGLGTSHNTGSLTTAYTDSLLLGFWSGEDTLLYFVPPSGMTSALSIAATGGTQSQHGLLIASVLQAATGSVSKTASSRRNDTGASYSVNAISSLVAVNPSQLPSAPTITYPDGGETITIGTTQTLTANPATSPIVAQSSLQYEWSYSPNNGVSWTTIGSLTSAGVTSKSWSTSGLAASANYLLRCRAWDGSSFGRYHTLTATFSLVAETTPSAPTNLLPSSGAKDRAQTIRLSWTHSGGLGNPQTAYSGEWSYNADMSSATSFSASSANEYHDIAGATYTSGNRVYWRVKTTGLTLQSAFSAVASFIAAPKPATPNITAPTNASPPTQAQPTITFTSADSFTARKLRILLSGELANVDSDWIESTALSFVSSYLFQDGVAVDVKLAVRNVFGLESDEDSETVTPSYTAPATPTLELTDNPDGGYIQATITNSDSPTYNQLWRYITSEGVGTAILIGDLIAADGTFLDFNVKSGIEYSYFARSVNATGVADSSVEAETLTLTRFWLHVLTKESATSNASGQAVSLNNQGGEGYQRETMNTRMNARGWTKPYATASNVMHQSLSVSAVVQASDSTTLGLLNAAWEANTDCCARNQKGDLIKGKIVGYRESRAHGLTRVSFTFTESDYEEDLSA